MAKFCMLLLFKVFVIEFPLQTLSFAVSAFVCHWLPSEFLSKLPFYVD